MSNPDASAFSRLLLSLEQVERLEGKRPKGGRMPIVFGVPSYADSPDRELDLAWVSADEAAAALETSGILAMGDRERLRRKQPTKNSPRKKLNPLTTAQP